MSELLGWLRVRRQVLEGHLAERGLLHTLSAARFQLHRSITRLISEYAHGTTLEAGAGRSPYAVALQKCADGVIRLDIDPAFGADVVDDIQLLESLPDASFDTVLSTQVLEHVPRPHDAMRAIVRILKPGGVLILSAPHLSMVHDAPSDYYRYTEYGLRYLCASNGLEVERLLLVGGPISLLAHSFSVVMMSALARGLLFWPVWGLNYVFLVRLLDIVDKALASNRVLARDVIVVAIRRSN